MRTINSWYSRLSSATGEAQTGLSVWNASSYVKAVCCNTAATYKYGEKILPLEENLTNLPAYTWHVMELIVAALFSECCSLADPDEKKKKNSSNCSRKINAN